MDKIYNIKYVDAYYSYAKNIDETKLVVHEAWGYMKKNGDNIVITFIKWKRTHGKEEVALGLVIPDTALISKKDTFDKKILENFEIGMSVVVTWRDVVIFDFADSRNDCPVMYTEGILLKIENDHIVLKDPETIRTYPTPVKNHPTEKPNFYIIPISFIMKIEVIK